jgi:LPXTG-motif cell wall-anchored protein
LGESVSRLAVTGADTYEVAALGVILIAAGTLAARAKKRRKGILG